LKKIQKPVFVCYACFFAHLDPKPIFLSPCPACRSYSAFLEHFNTCLTFSHLQFLKWFNILFFCLTLVFSHILTQSQYFYRLALLVALIRHFWSILKPVRLSQPLQFLNFQIKNLPVIKDQQAKRRTKARIQTLFFAVKNQKQYDYNRQNSQIPSHFEPPPFSM